MKLASTLVTLILFCAFVPQTWAQTPQVQINLMDNVWEFCSDSFDTDKGRL